mgnify:CR=1 FL=1
MKKEWKVFESESCPNCGDAVKVLSQCPASNDLKDEQWFADGEEVRCCADCGFISSISADDDGVWIQDGNIDELNN